MLKKYRYVVLIIVFILCITAHSNKMDEEDNQTSQSKEPIQLESQLKDIKECYLCGNSDKSMMSYYRQFDTIGLIGLNEWHVLDFGLGIEEIVEGTKTTQGHNQGVTYFIEATPSRGMSQMKVMSNEKFGSKLIEDNLCQECLDEVIKNVNLTEETPFVLVDFYTLKLYSIQKEKTGYFIRNYWVKTEGKKEIEIDVYYLPKK